MSAAALHAPDETQLRERLQRARWEAGGLLAGEHRHPSQRAVVVNAVGDLDETERWLTPVNDASIAIHRLHLVDMALKVAEHPLRRVAESSPEASLTT
jgi:hypothetical protein